MAKKYDSKDYDYKDSGKDSIYDDGVDDSKPVPPVVNILAIELNPPGKCEISGPLELKIVFDLDRDCVASYWSFKILVDSCSARIIRVMLPQ